MHMAYTVAVRALCEFTARAGDLDLRFTPTPSALEGMAGHRLVQARRSAVYEAEVYCSGAYQDLVVRGRADGFDPDLQQVQEIKTYRGSLDSVRSHHRALHWAQAKVYGHLLCHARGLPRLSVALVYFNVGTQKETVLAETYDAQALQVFFELQCDRFLAWARKEQEHRRTRDAALRELPFPMTQFRAGQRELAVAVYRCATAQVGPRSLMAQAPTGIGKTLGTLFPALKAMPGQDMDKVFFLTAKGTGHGLALQALGTLNQQLHTLTPAFQLRVLDMQSREKTCEHPASACHGDSCPLAKGFFDRLADARETALGLKQPWSAAVVREAALQHSVCPYYLSQELVRWSDVVVADYNYYYDAAAMLYALTQAQQWKVTVLVDEAHNLLDRARRMYTAELSHASLSAARKACNATVKKSLDRLYRHWNALTKTVSANYQAYGSLPEGLVAALQGAVAAVAEAQAEVPLLPGDPILAFYLQAQQFAGLAQSMGSHALFDISLDASTGARRPSSVLCIRNVVPAAHLAARHDAAHAVVLFSGTLSPPHFYRDMLGLPGAGWREVEAPFTAVQLSVQVVPEISTRYVHRRQSVRPIADLVARQYVDLPGNYLCFFSSFDYLRQVADALEHSHPAVPVWRQTPSMDEASRDAFLARFTEQGRGVGFAVLGGAFAEGIDLPGRRLVGAFIATLGLPQFNPINEQMKQAMDQYFGPGKGYDYTYLYPGLRKVVQAAGRVIRTEQDTGGVFLMDDRYQRGEVRALLPLWWQVDRQGPA
jgi:DNA excision repair protein ERCC-2